MATELRTADAAGASQILTGSVKLVGFDADSVVQVPGSALVEAIGSVGSGTVRPTWSELSGVTGAAGDNAVVLDTDTGTHTDPVVGGTVPNAGVYLYVTGSPAGWQRIGATQASLVNAAADRAEDAADAADASASAAQAAGGSVAKIGSVLGVSETLGTVTATGLTIGNPALAVCCRDPLPDDGAVTAVRVHAATAVTDGALGIAVPIGSGDYRVAYVQDAPLAVGINTFVLPIAEYPANSLVFYKPIGSGGISYSGSEGTFVRFDLGSNGAEPAVDDEYSLDYGGAIATVAIEYDFIGRSYSKIEEVAAELGQMQVKGSTDTDTLAVGNPAIEIACATRLPSDGFVARVRVKVDTAGFGQIVASNPTATKGEFEVAATRIFWASAGMNTIEFPLQFLEKGALISYFGVSGAALEYDGVGEYLYFTNTAAVSPAVGDVRTLTATTGVTPAIEYEFISAAPAGGSGRPVVYVLVGYGQSLSIGTDVPSPTALTTAQRNGQVRKFNGGVRVVRGNYDNTDALDPDDIAMLVPASANVEGWYGETHLEGLGYKLAADLGWNVAMFTAGVGGNTWAQLTTGTPWDNLTDACTQMQALLDAEGYDTFFIPVIRHGESEEAASRAAYVANLSGALDDMSALMKGISGQLVVPFFMSQPPGLLNASEVPQAILDVADARDDLFVVGGFYGLPFSDSQHLTSEGYHYDADITAEFIKEWWNGGRMDGTPQPMRIVAAATNVGLLDLTFAGMKGLPVSDTGTATPSIAGFGLELFDDASSGVTVTSLVGAVNATTLRFNLSANWTASGKFIRSAYTKPSGASETQPAFYMRTNIRDSLPIASRLDNTRLYRRLVSQKFVL